MLIGKDFEKIQWDFFGLDFVEPNAFYGDALIFIISLLIFFRINKMDVKPFYWYWKYFYLIFGISFILGGFGHLCFNYTGVFGKYPSWILGMIAIYFTEMAMISINPNKQFIKKGKIFILIKLILLIVSEILVFICIDLNHDPSKGLIIPTIGSVLGLGLTLGYLSVSYQKNMDPNFKYFWIAALILIPNAFIQGMKINIHPWFDRNDFSHVLLILSIIIYYQGIRKVRILS